MTENQKKIAIIVVCVLIGLFLLIGKGGIKTILQHSGLEPLDVSNPSSNIPADRGNIVVNIPGLPSFTPYQYSAVSPCMCNGAAIEPAYQGPLVTFVTNQGNSGPNIYNYQPPAPMGAVMTSSFG